MNYQQALDYIHGTLRLGSHPGLGCIRSLLARMGDPQKRLRFVHVAGTNGKGSTCAAVASVLQRAGYKTGLYISPFIEDFCERIQVDGEPIPHGDLARLTEEIYPLAEAGGPAGEGGPGAGTRHPTEFEIVTALAFRYFAEQKCDVVVLEVGLGGRLDATNVIPTPLVSVIASISFDHMEILGHTLAAIAGEKSGIIKPGGFTVTSPGQDPEALAVIMEHCARAENPLTIPNLAGARVLSESIDGTRIRYRGTELFIPLCGRHQIANFLTAYETLDILRTRRGFAIPESAVAEGFAAVRFPARMEILHRDPLVIVDGAHNPAGAATLADSIDRFLAPRPVTMIAGVLADKEYRKVLPLFARRAARFIAVRPDSPRALPPEQTCREAQAFCPAAVWYDDYARALADAVVHTPPDGALVVCGSLYLAGPMRRQIRNYFSK